ncbi:MAG: DUF3099 domain-containing protein [Tetrasphaera sp.]|jgi:hypothetical protein|nr:DUF3099 domain-containing protein [Tetrasphaera sp.]
MRKATPVVVQSVTSAPESLQKEQEARIKRYLLTMLIRTGCFVAAVPLHGWMRWTSVAMAVVLPYIAVVFANAVKPRAVGVVAPVLPTAYAVPSLPPPRRD